MKAQSTFPVLFERTPTSSSDPTYLYVTHGHCEWSDDEALTVSKIISIAESAAQRSKHLKLPPGQQFVTHVYEVCQFHPPCSVYSCIKITFPLGREGICTSRHR